MSAFGLDEYFYNRSIKKYISLFGSIFTDLYISRQNGESVEYFKVPIKYGNGNRYMNAPQGVEREGETKIARVVPAMMFELKTFYKDVSRKTNARNILTNPVKTKDDLTKEYVYNPVPYNFIFELHILTKNMDDMLQITEQIVPAFDPNLTITIMDDNGKVMEIDRDIPIILQEIDFDDNYDEDVKRMITNKITFELKGFLYKKLRTGYVVTEAGVIATFDETFSEFNITIADAKVSDLTSKEISNKINNIQPMDIDLSLFKSN